MARAKANLETMDVIGFNERHEEFLDELVARYGFRRARVPDQHVTDGEPLPAAFVERIRADNAADVELYEHATRLVEARRSRA